MPRNKTVRQLLAWLSLGIVLSAALILATCGGTDEPPPPSKPTEATGTVVPSETTRTVETSSAAKPPHNPTSTSCVVCHLLPPTHGVDPYTCAKCHTYPDWHTATHPSSPDCESCHTKPDAHPSTSAQCSTCHKNTGENWSFQHTSSADCAECHTAPESHYGTDCNSCHDPSVAFADTQYAHNDSMNCADCHTPPHRSYAASCVTCHQSAGDSWGFTHPENDRCQTCHTPPAGHFGSGCSVCHSPKVPFKDTAMVHDSGTSDCLSCHTPPHRSDYPVACASCHPLVGSAWLPTIHTASTACAGCHTPPAAHYGAQCSACHSPSVPFADAKVTHGPATTQCQTCHTAPHAAYPVACAECHKDAGTTWAVTHPSATSDCASCHTAPAGHPAGQCSGCHTPTIPFADTQHPGAESPCQSCHTPPHRTDYPVACASCHPLVGSAWLPTTHTASTACASCHAAPADHYGAECSACHSPSVPFADAKVTHGPATTQCQTCHTAPHAAYPVACAECHKDAGTTWAVTHPSATSDCASCHTPAHRADYPVGCTSCHPQVGVAWTPPVHTDRAVCSDCHTAPAGHPAGQCSDCHTPTIPFADTQHPSAESPCQSCHTPPHRSDYPVACASCHPLVGSAWLPTTHTTDTACAGCHTPPAAHYGAECSACHSPSVPFADAKIVHGPTTTQCQTCHTAPHAAYPVACAECHKDAGVTWAVTHPSATSDCALCHTPPAAHYGAECSACHSPSVPFADAKVTHGPATTQCQTCHTAPHAAYPVACAECHKDAGTTWAVTHPSATSDCASCHVPTAHAFAGIWCEDCHVASHEAGANCEDCHNNPEHGTEVFTGTPCSDCHTVLGFMDISLAPKADSVVISWTALTAGSTYEVVRATNAGFTAGIYYVYSGPWAPSVTDSDPATLRPGVVYYYQVRARLSDGTTARSAPTATTLTGMTPLVATPQAGGWNLAWTGGQAGYTLMVNGAATVSVSSTTYFFAPAAPGVYVLAVRDSLGRLGGSVTVTSVGYVAPLAQPSVTASAGTYQLDWSGGTEPYTVLVDGASAAIANAPTYLFDPAAGEYSIVVRDADGARTIPIDIVKSAEGTSAPLPSSSPKGYVEDEFPDKADANSADSSGSASAPQGESSDAPLPDAKSDTGDASTAPEAPHGFEASAKGSQAAVSWTAENDMYYEVQQAKDEGFSSPTDAWSGSGDTAAIGSFDSGDVVWLRVRARTGQDGQPSEWSAATRVEFPKNEKAPDTPAASGKEAGVPDKDAPVSETPKPPVAQQPTVDATPPPEAAEPEDPPAEPAPDPEPAAAPVE